MLKTGIGEINKIIVYWGFLNIDISKIVVDFQRTSKITKPTICTTTAKEVSNSSVNTRRIHVVLSLMNKTYNFGGKLYILLLFSSYKHFIHHTTRCPEREQNARLNVTSLASV